MPKRNIYLLGSLMGLLAFLTVMVLFENFDNTVSIDKDLFKVADQTKIDRVVLQRNAEQTELHFDGTRWMVNNSFEADRQLIQVFFATILQTEPKRPVAQRLIDSVNQQIISTGVQVKLFEGEVLMKDFSVAGNDRKTETYYQLAGDPAPYIATIPGYRVYVGAIFELPSYEWREKRIFNFRWENFKQLKVSFAGNKKEDFSISFQGKFFGLDGNPAADTTRLNDYLDAVSLVQAMRYLPKGGSTVYDSLLTGAPSYTIQAIDIANRTYVLDVYPPIRGESAILAKVNGDQPLLMRKEEAEKISRSRSYFVR
jgi:hypothetical protein